MTQPQAPKHTALLPVRVKALDWQDNRANSILGVYSIGRIDGAWRVEIQRTQNAAIFTPIANGVAADFFAAFEEAQAAAQADYEARILSAIEPDPSSSAQEVRVALTAALRFIRNTDDESGFGTQRMEGDAFYLKAFLLADRIEAALASAPPVRTNAEGDQ